MLALVGLLAVEHRSKLIGDLLETVRMEAGLQVLDHAPFRPTALAEEMAAIGGALLIANGRHFEVDVADDLPELLAGDIGALRQIILNLLHNAGKFTDAGLVRLSMDAPPDRGLFVAVSDTGRGIPADRQVGLFSPQQGEAGRGLAACRRLVELMGGQIGVDSQDGAGTTVWFEVPLPPTQPPLAGEAVDHVPPPCTVERTGLLTALSRPLTPGLASRALPPPPDIPSGLESLMATFIAEMAKDTARLCEIAAADSTLLAEQAHATRGKCGMFGEAILFDLLTRLEDGAAQLNEDQIAALLAEIVERTSQLEEYEATNMVAPS